MAMLDESAVTKVTERLLRLRDDIARSIGDKGLTASGRTAAGMTVVSTADSVTLYGRAFFPALETGSSRWTGATGVRCSVTEFYGIIRDWATAKCLNFGQAAQFERTVRAIAWSIIKRGTKQRGQPRLDVYTTLVDEATADCLDILCNETGAVVDQIIRQWR